MDDDDLASTGVALSHFGGGGARHSFDGGGSTLNSGTLRSSLHSEIKMEQCDQFVVDDQQLVMYHDLLMDGGGGGNQMASSVGEVNRRNFGGARGDEGSGQGAYWSSTSSSTPSTGRSYTSSATAGGPPPEPASQVDVYRDLILRHLLQDINTTCAKLSLPTNPLLWDVDDCVRWMVEQCHQFTLSPAPSKARLLQALPALQLGGRWMVGMSVDDFCRCLPEGGDTLHAQLQLWKTATCDDVTASMDVVDSRAMNTSKALSTFDMVGQGAPQKESAYAATARHNNHIPLAAEGGDITDDDSSGSSNSGEFPTPFLPFGGRSCIVMPEQTSARQHPFLLESSSSLQFLHSGAARAVGAVASSVAGADVLMGASTLGTTGHHHSSRSSGGFNSGNGNGMELPSMTGGDVVERARLCSHQSRMLGAAHCGTSNTIHLWHFIRELLDQPDEYGSCVRWVDRQEGTFKIESSHSLARYWGLRKNRSAMNYDKLSRSLRQYYKKGIIRKPEKKQRLVYKFLPPYNL